MTKRIIIHDASILIEIHRVGLLRQLASLPFDLWVLDIVWEAEVLSIPPKQKEHLVGSFKIQELTDEQILYARALNAERLYLSLYDCSTVTLAKDQPSCILLCSDRRMRSTAQELRIEVHGVFWLFDRLHEQGLCSPAEILRALQSLASDPSSRLPAKELQHQIQRYSEPG